MRLVSRPSRSVLEQRREQSRRKRVAAGTIGNAFPAVEQLQMELSFLPTEGLAPVRQLHAMYPPAPAYFEFACPYGDCDGSFDLTPIASDMMSESASHAVGTIECPGSRAGPGLTRQPCGLRLRYRIAAQYEKPKPRRRRS